ncbi:hypothetical protein PIB30_112699, partial [Stylosanthes scabra]|nr:hypothetical protein [Stylosanthes scabra]
KTLVSRKPDEKLLPECVTKPPQSGQLMASHIPHNLLDASPCPIVEGLQDLRFLRLGPCKLLLRVKSNK